MQHLCGSTRYWCVCVQNCVQRGVPSCATHWQYCTNCCWPSCHVIAFYCFADMGSAIVSCVASTTETLFQAAEAELPASLGLHTVCTMLPCSMVVDIALCRTALQVNQMHSSMHGQPGARQAHSVVHTLLHTLQGGPSGLVVNMPQQNSVRTQHGSIHAGMSVCRCQPGCMYTTWLLSWRP